jgi:hypothetical protein
MNFFSKVLIRNHIPKRKNQMIKVRALKKKGVMNVNIKHLFQWIEFIHNVHP